MAERQHTKTLGLRDPERWQRVIDHIEGKIARGHLIPARELMSELGFCMGLEADVIHDLVVRQYRIAVEKGNWGWVAEAHKCEFCCSVGWMRENIPHKNPKLNKPRARPVYHHDLNERGMVQDYRLNFQTGLVTTRFNAATGEEIPTPTPAENVVNPGDGHHQENTPSVGVDKGLPSLGQPRRHEETKKGESISAGTSTSNQGSQQTGTLSAKTRSLSRPPSSKYNKGKRPYHMVGKEGKTRENFQVTSTFSVVSGGEFEVSRKVSRSSQTPVERGQQTSQPTSADLGEETTRTGTEVHKKKNKQKQCKCPVEGCLVKTSKLKHHVLYTHVSPALWETKYRLEDPDTYSMGMALDQLAEWILGAGTTKETLWKSFIADHDEVQKIPSTSELSTEYQRLMNHLCFFNGWKVPEKFTLKPPNSPAVIIHWRIISLLLNKVTQDQRSQFRKFLDSRLDEETTTTTSKRDLAEEEDPVQPNTSEPSESHYLSATIQVSKNLEEAEILESEVLSEAWDSHFHLDRTSRCLFGRGWRVSSEELLRAPDLPVPKHPVQSIHGIEVYSEPDQYPADLNRSEDWKVALGVHPKVIQRLTGERLQRLGELVLLPQVVALGKIGLDRTTPPSSWKKQEETLVRLLELGLPRKPIIMHIRGTQEDKYGIDVSNCAMMLMLQCCSPLQRIHLHCFNGNRWLIHRWMKAFSNIYFGFTGLVVKFDNEQRRALQEVPADRLLIETDSPYFPLTPEVDVNTPRYIGDVAAAVAEVRGVSTQELLDITVANTKNLYQI